MKHVFPIVMFLLLTGSSSYGNVISGVVINSKDKEHIGHVRIAIENCISVLSDSQGRFNINLPRGGICNDNNTLMIFDRPGYTSFSITLKDFRASDGIISMNPFTSSQLQKPKSRLMPSTNKVVKEGITRGSSTFIFMLDFMNDIGGEFGIIIGKNAPCNISSLNLYIGNSKIRHLKFRVNLYDITNHNKRINDDEIIVSADLGPAYRAQDGWVKFDMAKFNLIIDREVYIVLENIYHPRIASDIELSCPGVNAMIGKSNFFYRLSPFDDFERVDIKVSIFAEVMPVR